MALLDNAEPEVQANHERIVASLQAKEGGDARLAEALYLSWQKGYYRLLGFRSLGEYLREQFVGTELDSIACLHARAVQRLIREWKLAAEIPAFRQVFSQLSRSKRRLIAQVLTPENADEWIARAKSMNVRELEELITKKAAAGEVERDKPTRWVAPLYAGQREMLEQALALAGEELAKQGSDPASAIGMKLEMLAVEFIATYGRASVTECPGCGVRGLVRRPEEDQQSDDGRKLLISQCAACQRLALVAVLLEEEGT